MDTDYLITQTLLEPGFVLSPQCGNQWDQLSEGGRRFFDEKYKSHFDGFFTAVGDFFRAMGEDPINKR